MPVNIPEQVVLQRQVNLTPISDQAVETNTVIPNTLSINSPAINESATNSISFEFDVGYSSGQVDPRIGDLVFGSASASAVQQTSPVLLDLEILLRSALSQRSQSRAYFPIEPLNNRYDFLTGKKLRTL